MRRSKHAYESVLGVLIVGVMLVAWRLDPSFVSWRTQSELSAMVVEPTLIALAMTLVVLTGGIDLSVGAAMSLAGVAFGLCYESHVPLPLCALLAVATGAACGLFNGLAVTRIKVHPLIVTLATMAAFFGLAEGMSHARPISGFSEALSRSLAPPLPAVIVGVLAVASIVFLANTVWGQALFAIGNNETAARFSGIPVDRIKTALYVFSGTTAGMAAVLYAARRNTVKADIGQGMELEVITAVVLGGTAITGGKGSVVGTLLGVLLLHEVSQFVSWHWERDEIGLIVVGAVLILAVLANSLFDRARKAA